MMEKDMKEKMIIKKEMEYIIMERDKGEWKNDVSQGYGIYYYYYLDKYEG